MVSYAKQLSDATPKNKTRPSRWPTTSPYSDAGYATILWGWPMLQPSADRLALHDFVCVELTALR